MFPMVLEFYPSIMDDDPDMLPDELEASEDMDDGTPVVLVTCVLLAAGEAI